MAMDKKLKKDMMHASSGNDVPDKDASPDPIFCEKEEEVIPNLDGQSFDPMPPMPSFAQGPGWDQTKVKDAPAEDNAFMDELSSMLQDVQNQIYRVNQSVEDLNQRLLKQDQSLSQSIDEIQRSLQSRTKMQTEKETISPEQLQSFGAMLQAVAEKQDRNDRQIAQTLRENANFQIQVRQGMQHDLDELKAQSNGEQFNPILKEIATLYVEYHSLLEEQLESRVSKNLMAMFEQMADLLADYEAEVCRTPVGEVRQTRICKVVKKIPTGDKKLHNTVANSRKPGVVRGRTVLYPEFVDVYVYDSALEPIEAQDNEPEETFPVVPEPVISESQQEEDC